MVNEKTVSGLGLVKTFKYYSNNSLKEDPKECAIVGDGMENAGKHLLERKKFSRVWYSSVLLSLTALYPTPGMSFPSPWNIPSYVPGARESHGHLNCPCTQDM